MLRMLDLFSGVGMWSYAFKSILRTVAYCEIDCNCQTALKRHMEQGDIDRAGIFNDVRDVTGYALASLNIQVGCTSSPCQDVSNAHPKGQGLNGKRSSLFFQVLRIVDELQNGCHPVKLVLFENSHALMKRGLQEIMKCFK